MIHRPGKRRDLRSIRLSLADVKQIYRRLWQLVDAEAEREIGEILRPEGQPEEDFRAEMKALRERAFRITTTISGRGGESLFGDDDSVFDSPNLPHYIESIYMTNIVAYKGVANQNPNNRFELFLDFSKPPLLDSKTFVSSPTPNNSNYFVEAGSDAWVAAASSAIDGVVQNRFHNRSLIHRSFSYDFGLFFISFPVTFYVMSELSPFISNFSAKDLFVSGFLYVYIFFIVSYLYRILFGYTKWAFPTVELTDNPDRATGHRIFWSAIVVALLGNLIFSILG